MVQCVLPGWEQCGWVCMYACVCGAVWVGAVWVCVYVCVCVWSSVGGAVWVGAVWVGVYVCVCVEQCGWEQCVRVGGSSVGGGLFRKMFTAQETEQP